MVDIGQLAVLGVNKAVIVNTAVRHTCCSFSRLVLIQLQPGDRNSQIWYFYLRSQRLTFPFLSFSSPVGSLSPFRPIKPEKHGGSSVDFCRVFEAAAQNGRSSHLRGSFWVTSGWRSGSGRNVLLIAELTQTLWVILAVCWSFSHPSATHASRCFSSSFSPSFRMTFSTASRSSAASCALCWLWPSSCWEEC